MRTRSLSLAPARGWESFTKSAEVEELAWEMLATWHFMNPTAKTSVWESDSGATFYLAFDDAHQVIEAVAGANAELDEELVALCTRLSRRFGLVAGD